MPTVKSFCAVVTRAGFDIALNEIDKKTNELKTDELLVIQDAIHMLGQVPLLTRVVIYEG